MSFIYLPRDASKAQLREAENARKNRAEIIRAFSQGKVTRRELIKWGLMTTAGAIAPIGGLSPFVPSMHASGNVGNGIPTGAPPCPLFGVPAFSTPMSPSRQAVPMTNPNIALLPSNNRGRFSSNRTGNRALSALSARVAACEDGLRAPILR